MSQNFYELLTECIKSAGQNSAPADIDPAVWQEFCTDTSAPAAEVPEVRKPSGPVQADCNPVHSASWDELINSVLHCRSCVLCETRTHAVPGEGNINAELMFIGEGPGAEEDRTGRPFVGKAGQLLDKMIAAMKFSREEVYIANVVKCRPPENRQPSPDEAMACLGYLKRQIALIQPKAIVCLGGVALSFLLNENAGIMRMRGKWLSFDGIPVMPTFHPAYLLRQESAKRDAWNDLKQVMRALGKL